MSQEPGHREAHLHQPEPSHWPDRVFHHRLPQVVVKRLEEKGEYERERKGWERIDDNTTEETR